MDRLKKIMILAAIALSAASFAFADGTGRFVSVEGKVDLLKAGQSEAVPVATDDTVSAGDIIRTKSLSKTEVKFSDDSSLKIGENSRVQIKEYSVENGKRISGSILLERGNIRATVSKANGNGDFKIETPNATGSVKGTDLFVAFQKSATSVLVVNGKFSVANLAFPDKAVEVTGGNTTLVPADELPQPQREYLALEKNNYEVSTEPTVQKAVALNKTAMAEGYSFPGEMKAKVAAVSGSVRVRSRGSITWHDAKANETLAAGDTVETKENGKIEIRIDNGNTVDLKPNSQITLHELSENQKNGEYKNLFESKYGKLRAKVGKLKGDSKFEIKTPTAVAAVRGTIMYLNILPGLTSTYFEEGNGYVKSAISNISKIVAAGSTSSADSGGNVSNPSPVSDSDRSSWEEGWGVGGGAEGYSPPSGGNTDTGGDTGNNTGNTNTENNLNSLLNDIRTNDNDVTGLNGGSSEGPGSTEETGNLLGSGYGDLITSDEGSFYDGDFAVLLSGTIQEGPWAGKVPVEIAGTYETYSKSPYDKYIWQGYISGAADDGGRYSGILGGSWNYADSWKGLLAALYIDPTGKAGTVSGELSGLSTGETWDELEKYYGGFFAGTGNLIVNPVATVKIDPAAIDYAVWPSEGEGRLYGKFDGGGRIHAEEYLTTSNLIDYEHGIVENWGVYGQQYEGWTCHRPENAGFNAVIGGYDDAFGATNPVLEGYHGDYYYDDGAEYHYEYNADSSYGYKEYKNAAGESAYTEYNSAKDLSFLKTPPEGNIVSYKAGPYGSAEADYGYWIADVTDGGGNEIDAALDGRFLTPTKMGTMSGRVLGHYFDDGSWLGVGAGTWEGTPLILSGSYDSTDYGLNDYYGFGYHDTAGNTFRYGNYPNSYIAGLLGATGNIWSGDHAVTFMGEFYNPGDYRLWGAEFSATADGAKLMGVVGGAKLAGSLTGMAGGLYIRPVTDENGGTVYRTGYFTTDIFNGKFYDSIAMFEGTGLLTVHDMGTTKYTPEDLYDESPAFDNGGEFEGFINGDIAGTIGGDSLQLHHQNWGVWKSSEGGSFADLPVEGLNAFVGGKDDHESRNSYYIVKMTGEGWSDLSEKFTAALKGISMDEESIQTISGNLVGDYSYYGEGSKGNTWEALSIGTGIDQDLTLSGHFGDAVSGLYYRYLETDGYYYISPAGGHVEGLLGSTTANWWTNDAPFDFIAMGEFSDYAHAGQYYWQAPVRSYNGGNGAATTIDEAAFYGYSIGTWDSTSGIDNGKVAFIYLAPDGRAGICYGDITNDISGFTTEIPAGTYIAPSRYASDPGHPGADTGLWLTGGTLLPIQFTDDLVIEGNLEDNIVTSSISGKGYGSKGESTIFGLAGGSTYRLAGQDWGIWTTLCSGSANDFNNNAWVLPLGGKITDNIDKSVSYWVSVADGNSWEGGVIKGSLDGVTLRPEFNGDKVLTKFYLSKITGGISGTYSQESNWQAAGVGSFEGITELGNNGMTGVGMAGYGLGKIGNDLMAGLIVGQAFASEGTYKAVLAGTGNIGSGSEWSLALGAKLLDSGGFTNGYLLAADRNDPEYGDVLQGVYFKPVDGAMFEAGKMRGSISEITNVDTTWTATSTGEWVDLAQLSTGALGFDNVALANMVSVPITETYASMLTGGAGPGATNAITSMTMDMSMYASAANALSGIWASIINGNYNGTPGGGSGWSVNLNNGADNVNLAGSQWIDGKWVATVTGTVNNAVINGQAGGTYTDGSLTGVGAGTWQQPTPPTQQ